MRSCSRKATPNLSLQPTSQAPTSGIILEPARGACEAAELGTLGVGDPLRTILLGLLVALFHSSVSVAAEIKVVPVSEATSTQIEARVVARLNERTLPAVSGLFKSPVVCGPRLWSELKSRMPDNKQRVGTATLMFDTRPGKPEWKIEALDLNSVTPKVRETLEMLRAEYPTHIPVETGVFRSDGPEILAEYLLRTYLAGELAVKPASSAALRYYWLMIPYDIEEPVFTITSSTGTLLVDVDLNGSVHWIDLLPADILEATPN